MSRLRDSVTIDDVARHVGVAKGTVSRVLNNYTDISDATRKRILKAVQDLGYQPSATARNLKRGRQDTLGIVIPVGHGSGADPSFRNSSTASPGPSTNWGSTFW
ncbi:LacI family DNA-binding transcriptional regulator [Roseibium aggregatum]|nr:LacI family DNA-binding transcriptional regulator [Roseibium aggregatum]